MNTVIHDYKVLEIWWIVNLKCFLLQFVYPSNDKKFINLTLSLFEKTNTNVYLYFMIITFIKMRSTNEKYIKLQIWNTIINDNLISTALIINTLKFWHLKQFIDKCRQCHINYKNIKIQWNVWYIILEVFLRLISLASFVFMFE